MASETREPATAQSSEDAKVEVHKPKPIHSWRELMIELGTIVLGVSIALAAEQTVEWLHWRGEVTEARAVIGDELANAQGAAIERIRSSDCVEKRLDELGTILDQASRTGSLPAVPLFGHVSTRIWPDTVWQTTMASQIATHFPQDERLELAGIYSGLRYLGEQNKEEQLVWASLYAMAGPGRRLDPASEAALRNALSQARWYNHIMVLAGGQTMQGIEEMKLPRSRDAQDWIAEALHRDISHSDICRPLGSKVPAQYGQSQMDGLSAMVSDWQKHPPFTAAGK